jgi:hypothetical protein
MVVDKEIMTKIEKELMNIENKITFKTTVQEMEDTKRKTGTQ